MLLNLINFLKGCVIVELHGLFLERFINICIKRRIYLWDIKKISRDRIRLKMSIRGFKMTRPIARKTHTRARIVRRVGLPFIVHRYRKRSAFFAGLILFALLIALMTSFIWAIEINGAQRIPENEIRNALRSCGLRVGVLKYGVRPDIIKREMLLNLHDLSWIWVDVRGTKAYVEVKERKPAPPIFPENEPCNVVAERDGVIKRLLVKSGLPVVKEGDAVKKGDLIVSGVLDSRFEGLRLVHSTATVMAETWYEKEGLFPLTREVKTPTGRIAKRREIEIAGLNIRLWLKAGKDFQSYDTETISNQLKLWGDYYLPVIYKTTLLNEVEITQVEMEPEEAADWYAGEMEKELSKEIEANVEIAEKKVEHEIAENGEIKVRLTLVCNEDIGKQVRIDE